jgi:hypothetical protein
LYGGQALPPLQPEPLKEKRSFPGWGFASKVILRNPDAIGMTKNLGVVRLIIKAFPLPEILRYAQDDINSTFRVSPLAGEGE